MIRAGQSSRRAAARLAAALMGGSATVVVLPCPAQAQADPIAAPPSSGNAQPAPATAPPAPPTKPPVFLDADGNPLPPEVQRELQRRYRNGLPPATEAPPAALPVATRPPAREGEIVVEGQRPRGSVVGDIPLERTFSPLDVRAYGTSNVGELIQALGPQVGSNSGQEGGSPIVLLNGRRVSSFAEIADIPSEAIERVEVFPEELALRYGFRPEQKVINIVIRERFRSILGQIGGIATTEGGYATGSLRANYFAIRSDTRFDFTLDYNLSSSLLESERDLAQLDSQPDAGRFRTLLPDTERLTLSGLVGGNPIEDVSATLTGRYEATGFQSLLGHGASGILARATDVQLAQLGTTLHGRVDRWQWTFTGRYESRSTNILNNVGAGREEARSLDSLAEAALLLNGPLLRVPAGPLTATIRLGGELRDFSSDSRPGGVERRSDLSRDVGAVQANIALPLSRRSGRGASPLGNLSVNATAEVETLSDVGTLTSSGVGINWSPMEAIGFVASINREEMAPTLEQLGAPLLTTANQRAFDFVRGEVVDIARTFGGNPALRAEERRVFRLGLTVRPLATADLVLSADYLDTRLHDPILPFPLVTPPLEAAFPERFARDADNRLRQVDARPLNAAAGQQQQLRWGFSLTRPLGTIEPWMRAAPPRTFTDEGEARAAAPPGAIVSMVPPGSALARRFENLASRLFVSIFHSWRLRDQIVLRDGQPPLDLLDGAALDLRGSRRRHRLEMQAGIFRRGLGARVSAQWQSGATLRGAGGAAGDLFFSDLGTVDINLFANLQERFGGEAAPVWARGTRISLGITNLFDARPEVRDAAGSTPLSYQPAFLDPLGRVVSLTIRKMF